MPSPFPGMDPYIEEPSNWMDFHDRFIVCIQALLLPLLRPKYVAMIERRLFVAASERPIYPDVSVIRTKVPKNGKTAAVIEADAPAVFHLKAEPIRQTYLAIIDLTSGNRIVTTIEVLSPDNKSRGAGRESYLQKRKELWKGGASLIEIDLLRGGLPTVNLTKLQQSQIRPWHYLTVVSLRHKKIREAYPTPLTQRLPRIRVPLGKDDSDIVLDLQAAFTRCYDEGPYPAVLNYHEDPPGKMTAEEKAWCVARLCAAGQRSGDPGH